ncbi:hypothetical protein ACTQ6A_00350 [Lachnospiraceae bacterium LCP25S3_G4]
MTCKSKIYWFEPIIFMFFGLFHLHRVWALFDKSSYAQFWLDILNNKGIFYFALMGILAFLCIAGIAVFMSNRGKNYRWRWIYIFGGGYVIFDLFAIAIKLEIWHKLLLVMFDINNSFWYVLWGGFVLVGLLSFVLGIHILKKYEQGK